MSGKQTGNSGDETPPSDESTLEGGAWPPAGSEYAQPIPERIGPYRILDRLGEGGFGVVYLAEQQEPVRRRVALKIIKPGMDSQAVIARFEAERQALALMDHPNVAKVFEAGTTELGRPYFAMEHVPGVPITEHCDRHKLNVGQRLDLFVQICEAVQHAHQKGVIHRDIKPRNILVAIRDGQAVPKVIDFGVAKALSQPLTERTIFTAQGQLIGTPEYMSPEQAEMTAQDIDTRSDIYSLGVLLYELLTGALPFDRASLRRAGLAEIQRIIREVEPPKPSTKLVTMVTGGGDASTVAAHNRQVEPRVLTRLLRGDLDWITMKALDKDRTRRYASASALAADIRHHLRHEPIMAGPPGTTYRIHKFVRRHRALVTGAVVVFLILLAGITGVSIALREAVQARAAEVQQRHEAERQAAIAQAVNDFLNDDLLASVAPGEQGLDVTVRQVLDGASKNIEGKFRDEPLVEASIRLTLANTYWRLGEYGTAAQHAERALELRSAELGDEHRDTLDSMNTVAVLYKYRGRYEEAEPLYVRALETRRRVLGNDHPETLSSMNNLAVLLRNLGKLDQAEALHREALDIRRRVLGKEHPDTLSSLANLAVLLWEKGSLAEAEPLARRALETRLRVLPADHPDTLQSMYSLAAILASQGELPEAEALYRRTLKAARGVFGDEHPRVATVLNDLARLLRAQEDYDAAGAMFREALALRSKLLGEEHWETADTRSDLGECLTKLERYEEAQQELLAAYRVLAVSSGEDHRRTIRTAERLAALFDAWGKPDEAAAWRARLKPTRTSPQRSSQDP